MWGAHLAKANLDGADLQNAQLFGSDLAAATLADANLAGVDFQAKSLSPGQFATGYSIPSNGRLPDATLRGAILHGATASADTKWPSGFDWAHAGVVIQDT